MRLVIIVVIGALVALGGALAFKAQFRQMDKDEASARSAAVDLSADAKKALAEPDPSLAIPEPDYKEQVAQIVPQLGAEDAQTRNAALDVLTSLRGAALPAVQAAAVQTGLNPSAKASLENVIPLLKTRFAHEEQVRSERENYLHVLLDAYDKYGQHNPQWDDRVHRVLPALFHLPSPQDRTAEQEARIRKVLEKIVLSGHCDDPVVKYAWSCMKAELAPTPDDYQGATISFQQAAQNVPEETWPSPVRAILMSGFQPWYGPFIVGTPAQMNGGADMRASMFRRYSREEVLSADTRQKWGVGILREVQHTFVPENINIAGKSLELHLVTSSAVDHDFGIIAAAIQKALPSRIEPLLLTARFYLDYGWEARGAGWANEVSEDDAKLFKERLTLARDALQKAYDMDPSDSRAPAMMVEVCIGLGEDRPTADHWYERAMKADPDCYDATHAMLLYLDPRWHGTTEGLLSFARAGRQSHNWRGRAPLAIIEAYENVSDLMRIGPSLADRPDERAKYLGADDIWQEIRSSFESYLTLFPNDRRERSRYARLAVAAHRWKEARAQFDVLGDAPWPDIFAPKDYAAARDLAANAPSGRAE